MEPGPTVELRNVSKHFGGTDAVTDVSIRVAAGRILCLLGDNGAGKSTLIKILSGVFRPSAGDIVMDGSVVGFADPRHARRCGIATVHQDIGTVPLMSVGRNFVLGAEPTRGWGPWKRLDLGAANRIALEQMRQLGITRVADGDRLVGTLSGGERQALAIGRAIHFGARVLILDEPTSALGVKEAATVLRLIAGVRDRGVAIVFITHNVQHAMAVGDVFVVLSHGRKVAEFAPGEKTRDEILTLMSGGEQLVDIRGEP